MKFSIVLLLGIILAVALPVAFAQCTIDAGCPVGEFCFRVPEDDPANVACQQREACTVAQCLNFPDYNFCQNFGLVAEAWCAFPCSASADCPANQNCHEGSCADRCVPGGDPTQCRTGENCIASPDGEVCWPGCTADDDCVTTHECDATLQVCVAISCTTDADCRGTSCVNSVCAEATCVEDGNCFGGELCGLESGNCGLPCPANDCVAPERCVEGVCQDIPDPCENVTCVAPETCDPATGQCVDLCESVTCTDPQTCNPENGQCEDPADLCEDVVCTLPLVCNPDNGECEASVVVPCTTDADCDGGFCIGGECAPVEATCTQDSDCIVGAEVCAEGVCVDRVCVTADDCLAGWNCEAGVCVQDTAPTTCTTDADCIAPQTCQEGTCQDPAPAACTTDADCTAPQTCQGGECKDPATEPGTGGCRKTSCQKIDISNIDSARNVDISINSPRKHGPRPPFPPFPPFPELPELPGPGLPEIPGLPGLPGLPPLPKP